MQVRCENTGNANGWLGWHGITYSFRVRAGMHVLTASGGLMKRGELSLRAEVDPSEQWGWSIHCY